MVLNFMPATPPSGYRQQGVIYGDRLTKERVITGSSITYSLAGGLDAPTRQSQMSVQSTAKKTVKGENVYYPALNASLNTSCYVGTSTALKLTTTELSEVFTVAQGSLVTGNWGSFTTERTADADLELIGEIFNNPVTKETLQYSKKQLSEGTGANETQTLSLKISGNLNARPITPPATEAVSIGFSGSFAGIVKGPADMKLSVVSDTEVTRIITYMKPIFSGYALKAVANAPTADQLNYGQNGKMTWFDGAVPDAGQIKPIPDA